MLENLHKKGMELGYMIKIILITLIILLAATIILKFKGIDVDLGLGKRIFEAVGLKKWWTEWAVP